MKKGRTKVLSMKGEILGKYCKFNNCGKYFKKFGPSCEYDRIYHFSSRPIARIRPCLVTQLSESFLGAHSWEHRKLVFGIFGKHKKLFSSPYLVSSLSLT